MCLTALIQIPLMLSAANYVLTNTRDQTTFLYILVPPRPSVLQWSTTWHDSKRRTLLSAAMLSHGLLTMRSSLRKEVSRASMILCRGMQTAHCATTTEEGMQSKQYPIPFSRVDVWYQEESLLTGNDSGSTCTSHRPPGAIAFSAAGGIIALKLSIQRWSDIDRLQDRLF